MASLLPSWNHVCVPSKVVSAICSGIPVLYNANEESEGAYMFSDAIWLVSDSANIKENIAVFLGNLSDEDIVLKKKAAGKYTQSLLIMENDNLSVLLEITKINKNK